MSQPGMKVNRQRLLRHEMRLYNAVIAPPGPLHVEESLFPADYRSNYVG